MIQSLNRYRSLVDDFDSLCAAATRPLPLCIWTNSLKTNANTLHTVLAKDGIQLEPIAWPIDDSRDGIEGAFRAQDWHQPGTTVPFVAGWYLVQEEIAMTAVKALDPQPGEMILDLCAAPGNKTVQIASRLSGHVGCDTGLVVANEWKTGRLASLWSAIARMGLLNVLTLNADGRTLELPCRFDRVLVDVPCSAEGTLRKKIHRLEVNTQSEIQHFAKTQRAIAQLVPVQQALLDRALHLTRPGGIIVYSTCTFSPEENEAVLNEVVGDRGIIEPFQIRGLRSSSGLTTWQGQRFRSDLAHAHRYFPHYNDTGGFFVARIRRTGASTASSMHQSGSSAANSSKTVVPQAEVLTDTDLLQKLGDRFGIESTRFQNLRLLKKGRDKLWLLSFPQSLSPADHLLTQLIETLPFQNLGLPLLRNDHKSAQTKPTTAALQRLGPYITRNVVELTELDHVQAFLDGRSLSLSVHETQASTLEQGYVHVRARMYGEIFELGCGLYRQGHLLSQIPKSLRLA